VRRKVRAGIGADGTGRHPADAARQNRVMRPSPGVGERWRAGIVAAVVLALVLLPLTRSRADDSFPLSNYPMFTADKPRVTVFFRARAIGADGSEETLPAELVGGTVEVVQAARAMSNAYARGRIDDLCLEIAARTAAARPGSVAVEISRERYDVVDALRADDPAPRDRTVVARCPL
jgi:hypothetical protein